MKDKTTLDTWIDASYRCLREQIRDSVRAWIKGHRDLQIGQLERAHKTIESFIDFLKRQEKCTGTGTTAPPVKDGS